MPSCGLRLRSCEASWKVLVPELLTSRLSQANVGKWNRIGAEFELRTSIGEKGGSWASTMPSARPKSALVFGAIAAFIIYQYSAFLMPTSKLVSAPVVDQSPPASLFPIESPAARSQSIPSIESASSSQSPKASESPALSASPVQRHAPIPPYQNKEGQLSRNWMMYGNIETGHYFLKVVYAFDEIGFEDFGSSQSRQKNLMNLIRDGFELVKGERLLAALGSPATVACVAVFGWDIVNGELSSPFPDCPRVYQFSSSTREGALKTIPDMFFDGWPEVTR